MTTSGQLSQPRDVALDPDGALKRQWPEPRFVTIAICTSANRPDPIVFMPVSVSTSGSSEASV
jgi:hypothetical protein